MKTVKKLDINHLINTCYMTIEAGADLENEVPSRMCQLTGKWAPCVSVRFTDDCVEIPCLINKWDAIDIVNDEYIPRAQ